MEGCGEAGALPEELAGLVVNPAHTAFDRALASVFTAGSQASYHLVFLSLPLKSIAPHGKPLTWQSTTKYRPCSNPVRKPTAQSLYSLCAVPCMGQHAHNR